MFHQVPGIVPDFIAIHKIDGHFWKHYRKPRYFFLGANGSHLCGAVLTLKSIKHIKCLQTLLPFAFGDVAELDCGDGEAVTNIFTGALVCDCPLGKFGDRCAVGAFMFVMYGACNCCASPVPTMMYGDSDKASYDAGTRHLHRINLPRAVCPVQFATDIALILLSVFHTFSDFPLGSHNCADGNNFTCYNGGSCDVTSTGNNRCLCPYRIAGRQCEISECACVYSKL